MSLAVAIQMDPIENIDIDADSTFMLAMEAQTRRQRYFTTCQKRSYFAKAAYMREHAR